MHFLVVRIPQNKQVYAVEFTDMANHARRLVAKNGMEDVVEVIQCSVEDLKLDAKVRAKQSLLVYFKFSFFVGVGDKQAVYTSYRQEIS